MASSPAAQSWPWLAKGFASTRWSLVRRSVQSNSAESKDASEVFCSVYWYPLYGCLRAKGYGHADAQDHVQSFLAKLMHDGALKKADPGRGRLRNYLITMVLRHAASRLSSANAIKRGGGATHLALDWSDAETDFLANFTLESEPEVIFRRGLAVRLVEESVTILRAEFCKAGRSALFESLLPSLEGVMEDNSFAELGRRHGMNEGAVRVAACRLRERFRKCLRGVASQALGIPVGLELDEELRLIFC